MNAKEKIKKEIDTLLADGIALLSFKDKSASRIGFGTQYQIWYTRAIKAVSALAPDRLGEFRNYYERDPKRKQIGVDNYTIQDYLIGITVNDGTGRARFDVDGILNSILLLQVQVLGSLRSRIDGILADLEALLASELLDAEITTAKTLQKVNLRASGALAGVILEEHLQRVAQSHSVEITKKNPTIADLNEPLRLASVYGMPEGRRIQFLSDIRNLCAHKKEQEPTTQQVADLLDGVSWAIKNIT